MEQELLKLVARLGLIALLIWVVAAALGKRKEATVKQPRRQNPRSIVWNQPGTVGPNASGGLLYAAGAMAE